MRSGAHDARLFELFPAGAAGPPQGDRLNFIPMQKAQRRNPVTHRTPGRLLHRPACARTVRLDLWRAVEAQHVAATMRLVDSLDEQQLLERLLESSKPPLPEPARKLHWLLFTPFRYPAPPGGSRFRGVVDPGVFYGADVVRTACAELGYWRWRHLADSPGLDAMPTKPQTLFRARIATVVIDLRSAPWSARRALWTQPSDYAATQALARKAREDSVGAIRYESVRDPEHGGCCAVLTPVAFDKAAPLEQQTWMLSVTRERVVWRRTGVLRDEAFEFAASGWHAPRRSPAPRRAKRASSR